MIPEGTPIWFVIIALGIGTFLIRFSFLGLVGNRPLPGWMLRHLRYTGVTVIPALVAPLVLWPAGNGGTLDPWLIAGALAALAAGYVTRGALLSIIAGAVVLIAGALLG